MRANRLMRHESRRVAVVVAVLTAGCEGLPPPLITTVPSPVGSPDPGFFTVMMTGENGEASLEFGVTRVGDTAVKPVRACNSDEKAFHPADFDILLPEGFTANWSGIWDDHRIAPGDCLAWAHIAFHPSAARTYEGVAQIATYLGLHSRTISTVRVFGVGRQ